MKTTKIAQKKAVELEHFEGYLCAKLQLLGSRSEGPQYFLQDKEGKEIHVLKKVHLWEKDPALHACLGEQVTLLGRLRKEEHKRRRGIEYTAVLNAAKPLNLGLKLSLKEDILWVDKMLPAVPEFPPVMKNMALYFSVQWPYRSIWEEEIPSSQFFDFWIENPRGENIWQWSKSMLFLDEPIKVSVPGGSPYEFKIPWFYYEDAIVQEGMYVIRAKFMASGQEIRKPFWVKFAV